MTLKGKIYNVLKGFFQFSNFKEQGDIFKNHTDDDHM